MGRDRPRSDESGQDRPRRDVIRITLGPAMLDTAKALDAIIEQFPASVGVVMWLNEYFGPAVTQTGDEFERTPLYQRGRDRIAGVVRLKRLNPDTSGPCCPARSPSPKPNSPQRSLSSPVTGRARSGGRSGTRSPAWQDRPRGTDVHAFLLDHLSGHRCPITVPVDVLFDRQFFVSGYDHHCRSRSERVVSAPYGSAGFASGV
jgi:hypothetical protein